MTVPTRLPVLPSRFSQRCRPSTVGRERRLHNCRDAQALGHARKRGGGGSKQHCGLTHSNTICIMLLCAIRRSCIFHPKQLVPLPCSLCSGIQGDKQQVGYKQGVLDARRGGGRLSMTVEVWQYRWGQDMIEGYVEGGAGYKRDASRCKETEVGSLPSRAQSHLLLQCSMALVVGMIYAMLMKDARSMRMRRRCIVLQGGTRATQWGGGGQVMDQPRGAWNCFCNCTPGHTRTTPNIP